MTAAEALTHWERDLAAARARVDASTRVLVITHILPDGDAIGSQLGLGLALRAAGKTVVFAGDDPLRSTFRFLPSIEEITDAPAGNFDLLIAVDVSDAERMGQVGAKLGRRPHLLFDHHITNPGFADINFIDATAAAASELIVELLDPLGLPLPQPAAVCFLAGLVSDTIGFRTSNTTAKTLAVAQRLMETGASLYTVYDLALNKRSFNAVRLWAEGLARLRLDSRIVWATLPLEARKVSNYNGNGDADLINVLMSVREADVAIVLSERADGKVKVSWRSGPDINVAQLAVAFGGGGHEPAAGAEIAGTLDEVERKVIAATKAILKHET